MKRLGLARGLVAVAAVAIIAGACGSSPAASGGANAKYTIGFSNAGGVGNGWREAMLCSAKAQAVKAGNVSKVTIIHRDTDAPGQLADIRTLIAQGVNAIIINPSGPDALNPAIKEATDAGITVIAVDASVTAPGA
ncbi:MAG: substrate-binding domain-containing protein, partial [Candidatus Limnocylindrales bacterium]